MPIEQDDFPEVWSCDSPQKDVIVEIRLPDDDRSSGYSWIEIPTTSVELWCDKGNAARIQRTAKIRFPTTWGTAGPTERTNAPRDLIVGFEPQSEASSDEDTEPFYLARIWFQDPEGTWILKHMGWIGGVGPASDPGLSKMWVYDFAEMLSGVPIGETFNNPTIAEAAEAIARLTNDSTPIPLANVVVFGPETEEDFFRSLDTLGLEGRPGDTALGPVAQVDDDLGSTYYTLSGGSGVNLVRVGDSDAPEDYLARELDAEVNYSAIQISTGGIPIGGLDNKSFTANHDTLLDVYDWFERRTSSKIHFEPTAEQAELAGEAVIDHDDGPGAMTLVMDVGPERRVFAQDRVVEQKQELGQSYRAHQQVQVQMNDALYEMKPVNTVHLRGSTAKGWLDKQVETALNAIDTGIGFKQEPPSQKYPVVKVQVPALVEAAEGVELSGRAIESDAETLDKAKREATQELMNQLEEGVEGNIVLTGEPRIAPFDALDAFEVCEDDVTYEPVPVRYEVETVKHTKASDGTYQTRLNVSVWANDKTIEVVRAEMIDT